MPVTLRAMQSLWKSLFIAGAVALAASCATEEAGSPFGDGESVTIPYDPYNYDPDGLLRQAQAHCRAYGLNAVYVDDMIDPQSARWRYPYFDCV